MPPLRGRIPRIAGLLALALILFGAACLVHFAIISPELPPENLVSTLEDVATYYSAPENSYSSSVVILPPEEEQDWAALSAYHEPESPIGAGTQTAEREQDIEYRIRPGETLSEIAYSYNISYEILAHYNNITNANRIRVGTSIRIPSSENAKAVAARLAIRPRVQAAPRVNTKAVRIAYESRDNGEINGAGVTVQFSIVDPPPETLQSFEWNFGDGKRGFRPNPSYEYSAPRTYVASLTARDAAGTVYKSNPLYIDIPHPGSVVEHSTTKFVTLSSPDEYFVVYGSIVKVARYQDLDVAPLDLSESDSFLTKVRFTKPGYYGVTAVENSMEQYYSVFVSPVPTVHADPHTENYNWYRTQYNTGTQSNCGPAAVSMAIGWAQGKYYAVSSVRQSIGWTGDGGTSFEELIRVIRNQDLTATVQPLRTVQHIKDVIDSGSIAIILFHTSGIKTSPADPAEDLFGKYYNDSTGHYIVVKGYSLDGKYLVIHDPIPSDWGVNSFRYGDEISMIGKNRYYPAAEILRALRRNDMIVVPRAMLP
ncbi:MAG: LysM peptidoglycan-binding domain-containing protein [Spirochaetaceae bacterium]|nr:LysM peptidoglycan-binding domain-containing protein [Spirochaetaceae bacterium]